MLRLLEGRPDRIRAWGQNPELEREPEIAAKGRVHDMAVLRMIITEPFRDRIPAASRDVIDPGLDLRLEFFRYLCSSRLPDFGGEADRLWRQIGQGFRKPSDCVEHSERAPIGVTFVARIGALQHQCG